MDTANELHLERIAEHMPGVRPKPLEWVDHSKESYRVFQAQTEFGRFAYGTDVNKQSYYQTPDSEEDTETEEAAKIAAEEYYARLVFRKVATYVVPALRPVGPSPEVVAELQMLLAKYADDCAYARTWGGPVIYPMNPIDENTARKYGKLLAVKA